MIRQVLIGLVAAIAAVGADLPSAESLLERYIEVTGGKAAYDARKSEVFRGTVDFAALGVKGTVVRYAAEPDLYRLRMEFPGIGTMEAGVKNGVAWERSELLGPRVKTGNERAEAVREATLHGYVRWRELYKKVETTGEESVDGEECYKVTMTPLTEGSPETLLFSKKSGLALKMLVTASTQMGELAGEVLFRGYKDFGGILVPARVTEKTAGQEITITIESVEVNPLIPASQFDYPPDVAALLAKQPK